MTEKIKVYIDDGELYSDGTDIYKLINKNNDYKLVETKKYKEINDSKISPLKVEENMLVGNLYDNDGNLLVESANYKQNKHVKRNHADIEKDCKYYCERFNHEYIGYYLVDNMLVIKCIVKDMYFELNSYKELTNIIVRISSLYELDYFEQHLENVYYIGVRV